MAVILRRPFHRFDPSQSPSLAAWYDATDLATLFQDSAMITPVTADGQPVGAWKDKSGLGRHLTQAVSGNRPTYKTNIQNGLPIVRFDGTTSFLSNTGFNIFGSSFTVMAASNLTANLGSRSLIGGNSASALACASAAPGTLQYFRAGVAGFDTNVTLTTVWHVPAYWGAGGGTFTGNGSVDNGTRGSILVGPITAATGTILGADGAGPADLYIGDMGEVILNSVQLPALQITQNQRYLKLKWNTP